MIKFTDHFKGKNLLKNGLLSFPPALLIATIGYDMEIPSLGGFSLVFLIPLFGVLRAKKKKSVAIAVSLIITVTIWSLVVYS